GIAGTINIVTRNTVRKTATDLSTALSSTAGKLSSSANVNHHQSGAGSPLQIGARLSASQAATSDSRRLRQTLTTAGHSELEQTRATIDDMDRSNSVSAGADLTWQRAPDDTLSMTSDYYASRGTSGRHEWRQWTNGVLLDAEQEQRSALGMLFFQARWKFKPAKNSRVELRVMTNLIRMDTAQDRLDIATGLALAQRQEQQHRDVRVHGLDASYKVSLGGGHRLSAGADVGWSVKDSVFDQRLNGLPDSALVALGQSRHAVNHKQKLYAQDEWRVSESLALSGGLSAARNVLEVQEGADLGRTRYQVFAPSLHASKKIGADDKRQLRLSLARSYKAPENDSFTLRPEINPLAPCPASGQCGPNTIDTFDSAGNPLLRPEKALGLNLAYEHGIGDDSQVTLEVFSRRIDGKFGTAIGLAPVPWSPTPRYVARPVNLGQARSSGIDVEFELALRDLWDEAPKLNVRGSVGWARSRVASVPGPDNRLDKQTPWSAKLGASYTLPDLPVKVDLDASWSPSVWVRSSVTERISVARRFDLDASANWTISKAQRLVTGARAALPRSPLAVADYLAGGEQVRIETTSRRHSTMYLRFESSL
ncbi:MAG TPA: TonB-dependent receptor, partial [Telluria sp.]|nr:TonB-dependent receptor [Telluria sp.]